MGKQVRVNLTIDREVVTKAKEIGLNLSKVCENCLKQGIKSLESTMFRENPREGGTGTVGSDWCGRRDLNPGRQRGRLMS